MPYPGAGGVGQGLFYPRFPLKSPVIIVSGATATGKSALAIEMALQLKRELSVSVEIVNFDSLLFYRELNIGTARPSPEQMKQVAHHLVGIYSARNPMDAAHFSQISLPIIQELHRQKKVPLLVGGSGFYLQALMEGMYETSTPTPEVLRRSEEIYRQRGISPFIEELRLHDQESLAQIHVNDHYRLRRAVEHWWTCQTPWSAVAKKMKAAKQQTNHYHQATRLGWDVTHLYLELPRHEHWPIIIERAESMIHQGLIEEVRGLLNDGFTGQERPLQSIGYKESLAFIQGKIKTQAELTQAMAIATRQLAKAQRTWFNRDPRKQTLHPIKQRQEFFPILHNILNNRLIN